MASDPAPVLILAGGKSSRAGYPKGLIRVDGRTWLETQLDRLAECEVSEAVVVLGFCSDMYFEALPWLRENRRQGTAPRVICAVNPTPGLGPFSSILTGIRASASEVHGCWVLPVDVPCGGALNWNALRRSSADVCIPVFGDRGGHPVRLSARFTQRLLQVQPTSPEARLDWQIQQYGGLVERIAVKDAAVLGNLNTPEDWKRFCGATNAELT